MSGVFKDTCRRNSSKSKKSYAAKFSFLFNSPRPIFSAKGYNVIKFSIAWVNWEKNLQEEQLESKKKSEPKKTQVQHKASSTFSLTHRY